MTNATNPTVLVACPTASVKDYCLEAYLEAYNSFLYPYRDLFMVDNTAGDHGEYYLRLKSLGIQCEHIDLPRGKTPEEIVTLSWPRILQFAWEREFTYIFSLEIDVICHPESIDVLLEVAEALSAVHVSHSYHYRGNGASFAHGVGMNLFRRDLFTPDFDFMRYHTFESALNNHPLRQKMASVAISHVIDPIHMESPDPRYQRPKGHF